MPSPERLGKYLIRGELGRGAMGVVYEGFDPLIERTVAVKVLHIEPANAALAGELRQRFRREAQAAGRLSHPNIVPVYDYGEIAEASIAYIAMELVRGRDLKCMFDAGARFSLRETGRIMDELLAALQHAHERGVVHRDVKPGNIILLDDGTVKVTDFGIAKLDTSELTQTGSVLGTMSHMSPEQLRGEPVDGRSDLYSCGVILYQLLTGERPFHGSPAAAMHQVLHEEPPAPSQKVPGLSAGIDAVVRKVMAKSPQQRHANAAEFAEALRAALGSAADPERTVAASTPPAAAANKARPSRLALAGGLGLAAVAAAGVTFWHWAPAPPREAGQLVPAVHVSASLPVAPVASADAAAAPASEASRPVQAALSNEEIERLAWDDAAKAHTLAAYEAYLKGYPEGRFAHRARVRIASLKPRPAPTVVAAAPPPTPTPPSPPATPTASAAPSPVLRPGAAASSTRAPPVFPAEARSTVRGEPECAVEARRGDAHCQVVMGVLYRFGRGVPKDEAQALGWFRKAADQGDRTGQYELGLMHMLGLGGAPADARQAARWFRKSADQGEPRAQNRMGLAHEAGEGVDRSEARAADWYRKAAKQGFASSLNNLGRMYLHGRGVPKDFAKAAELLQKAAEKGEGNARFHLGWMYEKGEGKPRDERQAARLYRQALATSSLSSRNREAAKAFLAAHPAL